MIAALRYEWSRLVSLRSTWWITGLAVAVGAGFTFLVAMMIRLFTPSELEGNVDADWSRFFLEAGMTQFSNVDPVFYLLAYAVAVLGVLAWGHEYRHGMIRATLTSALPFGRLLGIRGGRISEVLDRQESPPFLLAEGAPLRLYLGYAGSVPVATAELASCSSDDECGTGESCSVGYCVDLNSDPNFCGGCQDGCFEGYACVNGVCV